VASDARAEEVERVLGQAAAWASSREDVVALGLVGSWAREAAHAGSDVDLVVLTGAPSAYTEEKGWIAELVPGATLVRSARWGPIVERRLLLPSGLEVDVGIGAPSWAETSPLDPGTRRVVRDGLRALHDPRGVLERLVTACR
jgi:hypothetical protein